jgi:hypothetical protein
VSEEKYLDVIELKLKLRFSARLTNSTTMKKFIEIEEEIYNRILAGKYVDGSLHKIKNSSMLVFRAFNRKPRVRIKDRLIRILEHGWVKESEQRIKVFESIPKDIGTPRVMNVLERELKEVKNALIERDIIENV